MILPALRLAPRQSGSLSRLRIAGIATVQFSRLVAPGEFQFSVVVPPSVPDGDQPIVATFIIYPRGQVS
jgi:hypothetical protein